jgi:hypothetical protein
MVVAAVGMTCLGFVVIYISMYFIARLKDHTVTGLAGVVGVLVGGVVAKFLADNTTAGVDTVWWYPIGLLIGLATWVLLRWLGGRGDSAWMGGH